LSDSCAEPFYQTALFEVADEFWPAHTGHDDIGEYQIDALVCGDLECLRPEHPSAASTTKRPIEEMKGRAADQDPPPVSPVWPFLK
jgi:hypothetical protein